MVGFFSHLLLDEICSVDLKGARVNKAFGTAIKLWAPSAWSTLAMYGLLELPGLAGDPAMADGPDRPSTSRRSTSRSGEYAAALVAEDPGGDPALIGPARPAKLARRRSGRIATIGRSGRQATGHPRSSPSSGRCVPMRQFVRSGLIASIVVGLAAVAGAQAPRRRPSPRPAPPPAKAAAPPPRPAILDQVLATVNGEPITRGELYQYLNSSGIPPGADEQEMYRVGIEDLVNFKLVNQYLAKQKIPVTEKEIDEEYADFEQTLKKDGQDIDVALAVAGITVAQVRDEMKKKLRWRKYVEAVATDANLKKYVADNKDVFNRTQVRASHIVLRVEPTAPAAEKEKVRQKLAGDQARHRRQQDQLRRRGQQVLRGRRATRPAPTAATSATSPARASSSRSSPPPPSPSRRASVSDPVETPFGYHLIQVTDRKEGTPVDFEQNKLLIQNEYAADLQERIVAEMRKTAKIDIKPMPADLFPKAPAPARRRARSPPRPARPPAPKAATPEVIAEVAADRRSRLGPAPRPVGPVRLIQRLQVGEVEPARGSRSSAKRRKVSATPSARVVRGSGPKPGLEPGVVEVGRDRELAVAEGHPVDARGLAERRRRTPPSGRPRPGR